MEWADMKKWEANERVNFQTGIMKSRPTEKFNSTYLLGTYCSCKVRLWRKSMWIRLSLCDLRAESNVAPISKRSDRNMKFNISWTFEGREKKVGRFYRVRHPSLLFSSLLPPHEMFIVNENSFSSYRMNFCSQIIWHEHQPARMDMGQGAIFLKTRACLIQVWVERHIPWFM